VSNPKPHRRLNLTQPTTLSTTPAAVSQEVETGLEAVTEAQVVGPDAAPEGAPENAAESVVRVMAYLSESEAHALDETWLRLRKHPARPSKSDILRAALTLALSEPDALADVLSQQHTSTLSRQRSSKQPRRAPAE
jgi:hypothetical protein